MPKYNKVFEKVLNEEVPVSDEEVFAASFDDESEFGPEDFSTEPTAPGFSQKYIERARTWTGKLEEFASWINGTEEDSLNKQFNDLDKEGTPFEGISKHSDKLTKIAADLSALSETIKGVILSADRKEQQSMEADMGDIEG